MFNTNNDFILRQTAKIEIIEGIICWYLLTIAVVIIGVVGVFIEDLKLISNFGFRLTTIYNHWAASANFEATVTLT